MVLVMYLATPPAARAKTAKDLGIDLGRAEVRTENGERGTLNPGQWLEHSRILSWFIVALGVAYLVRYFSQAAEPLNALNLNILNLAFLLLGFLLHGTPARLMRAVQEATPAVWGVILQFPFYAGIAGVITATNLNEQVASLFVRVSTPATFPALVAVYSAVLGRSCTRGGSSGDRGEYVMEAAHTLRVHLGWVSPPTNLASAANAPRLDRRSVGQGGERE